MVLELRTIEADSTFRNKVDALAKEAFPPEEYLAPETLIDMTKRDENFLFSALFEGDRFVGFTAIKLYKDLYYLFFLAIEPPLRSHGYGGAALETIKARYPDKVGTVDFEMPDEQAPNREQRLRRRGFYLRNGFRETGVFLRYFGVEYEAFATKPISKERFAEMMRSLPIPNFSPIFFEKETKNADPAARNL